MKYFKLSFLLLFLCPLFFLYNCGPCDDVKYHCNFTIGSTTYYYYTYEGFSKRNDGCYKISYFSELDDLNVVEILLPADVSSGMAYDYNDVIWNGPYNATNFYFTWYNIIGSLISGDNFMDEGFTLTVEKWGRHSHGTFSGPLSSSVITSGTFEGGL